MVFSAVALVAFSFAGMANNEVKEVEVKETKKESTEKLEHIGDINWFCVVEYISVYNDLVGTFGEAEAHENASVYYMNCLGY